MAPPLCHDAMKEMNMKKDVVKKAQKEPASMWTIILIVILAVYILSFIIPSGSYQYEGKIAVPGTYAIVKKIFLTPVDVILGIGEQAYSMFGKLFVTLTIFGGLMGIMNSTGVLDRALGNMIHRLKDKAMLIIPIYIFATGLIGCVGSMISTVVLFIPLGITIAKQLKTDRCFAVGLVIMGSFTGFMTSPINPLTGVLGQEIAGLPAYSGSGLRAVVTVINLCIVSAYLIYYAKRCQKNPVGYDNDFGVNSKEYSEGSNQEYRLLTKSEVASIVVFFGAFIFFAAGGPILGLNNLQLSSILLPVAFVEGLLARCDIDEIMKRFVKGTQGMTTVMVFMILAATVSVILNKSGVLDSIVYYISIPLNSLGSSLAAIGMFIANAFINIFIGSGSGQTSVVMPIMAPLSDVIGVTRQMAVLTLQYGDGFSNLMVPTSVNLMSCLALANLDLKRWYRFFLPCYAIIFVILVISIFVGTAIGF